MPIEENMTDLDDIVLPDEGKEVTLPEAKSAGLEVEIVDDTPAADRFKKPLPEDVTKALDAENPDEVEEYSAKVKQRIGQMKRAWHDERRRAEEAERISAEATALAKTALERLKTGEEFAVERAKKLAQAERETARRMYRDAYDAGDSEKLIQAQEALQRAGLDVERYENYVPQYSQPEKFVVQSEKQAPTPTPDPMAAAWAKENPWFGKNQEMTMFAFGVDAALKQEGVDPESFDFYKRIDTRLREKFPENFKEETPEARQETRQRPATVVAPVGRSPRGNKVVLTKSQVALANRLGISPEAYAAELVKLQEK